MKFPVLFRVEFGAGRVWLTRNSIKDINTHCMKQFQAHWDCLENNNHYLFECRKPEQDLNSCVFEKLVRSSQLYRTSVPDTHASCYISRA